jgi:hypothetical protein
MKKIVALLCTVALTCLMPAIPASALTCQLTGMAFPTSATTTLVIPQQTYSHAAIFMCGYTMQGTGGTVQLVSGTGGTLCAENQYPLSPIFAPGVVGFDSSSEWRGLWASAANEVCVISGPGTTAAQVFVFWTYAPPL